MGAGSSDTLPTLLPQLHLPTSPAYLAWGHAPADPRQAAGCDCIRKFHSAHGADLVVVKPELHQSERQWASALYRASAAFCKASKEKGEFFSHGERKQVPPKRSTPM